MEISYQIDLEHRYLRILTEEAIDMESYPLRILIGNDVQGLLPCRIESVDGQKEFCYEAPSEQTVSTFFLQKKLEFKQLKQILQGFLKALANIQSFLLDVNQIILKTEYMYYDSEREMLRFCYLPGYNQDLQTQFRRFMEELLSVINHQDSKAVSMGYGIYQKLTEEGFSLEIIREYLYGTEEELDAEAAESQEQEAESLYEESEDALLFAQETAKPKKEDSKASVKILVAAALWAMALLGAGVLRMTGYFSALTFSAIFGIFLIGMGGIGLSFYIGARKKGKPESAGWMPNGTADAPVQWPSQTAAEEQKREHQKERLVSQRPDKIPDILLEDSSVLIGKLNSAVDVVIPKSTVSRIHARIRRENGICFLIDLNSMNGTYINGKRIPAAEKHPLAPGDEIRFADVVYVYQR